MKNILTGILFFICVIPVTASELTDLIHTFRADRNTLERFYSLEESKEYYQRFTTFYKSWKDRLEEVDYQNLSRQGKADFVLLKNLVEEEDYFLQLNYDKYRKVAHVADFASELYTFIRERRRGKRPDAAALAGDFHQASLAIAQHMKSLKGVPFEDWMLADRAAGVIVSLRKNLEESYEFYNLYDPLFTWWMEAPYKQLSEDLLVYEEFLRENYAKDQVKDDGSGIIGKPIGKAALIKSLEFEFIPYTPKELIAAAEAQFEWCKNEMIKAAEEMGYGKDWRAALEHVKNTYVAPGEQPQAIYDLLKRSVSFVEERDLITLPDLAKETWGMEMMTAERQKVSPFFLGGRDIIISYPTRGMSHPEKMMSMRGNNPNFSYGTVQHELLPGHNLTGFMNRRNKPYRSVFRTPFWSEGWALYWEINLWNKGFPETPEQKMGMLFWRIHRCARIIFSLKYHLGEMTPQECIDLLVNEVGHEYANAEAEVRRSFTTNYGPLYQLAYMTGGLQFYALRGELLAQGWTEKEFHDRVLQEHEMPISVLRDLLLEKDIPKNYRADWRFSMDFQKN